MSVLCENCGQALPENTDICPNCGTPASSSEPQDVLAAAFAQIDQQQSLTPPEPPEPEPPPGDPQPEEAPPLRKKGIHKGLLLLGAVLVLMAALVLVLTRVSPKGGGLTGIAYLDEDHRLIYRRDAGTETTPIPLSELSAFNIGLTVDGNYLYYLHGDEFYRADLARAVEQGYTPEQIASDVTDYTLLQSGGVVYTTGNWKNTKLYYYDGWEPRFLADGGADGYDIRESEGYVYYSQYTDAACRVSAYCRFPLEEEGEPEKILDAYDDIDFLSDDMIVYTLNTDGTARLYAQSPGSERVCIADDPFYLLDVSAGDGRLSVTYCAKSPTQLPEHGPVCMELRRYEDGVTTVFAADIHDLRAYSDNIFIYGRMDPDGALDYYQNIDGQEFPFALEEGAWIYDMAVLNHSEAVLTIYKELQGELRSYTIGEGGLTEPAVIDSGFYGHIYRGVKNGLDALYYFEYPDDISMDSANLIRYFGGEKTTIAENIFSAIILPDSETMFTTSFAGVFDTHMKFTLSAVKDGETTVIADAVELWNITVLDENRVLYLLDGALYFWNGKTSEKLDENVKIFWVPDGAKASVETYYCNYYY